MPIATPNPWLTCHSPNPLARLRLFCFPYAGASGRVFRTWSEALPKLLEVCPIELPGRWTRRREALVDQLLPLVNQLCFGIRPLLDMPFALFGHSFGALLAFEVTRRLRRLGWGKNPTHLFLSGQRAPQLGPVVGPPIHDLPNDIFVDALDKRYGGVPEVLRLEPELLELFTPVMKADLKALETYVYTEENPLTCPITVFGGRRDKSTRADDLDGWSRLTTGKTSLHIIDGDHFFIEAKRESVLAAIVGALQQAGGQNCGRTLRVPEQTDH